MSNLFDLAGKTAIVTGSTRGIGRAIAVELARHGARVVVSSRKQGACDAVAAAINAECPGRAIAVAANIGARADLERLVTRTLEAFGRIDILVCNAASNPHFGPMAAITDEQFEKTFRNNVLSSHWLAGLVAPGMIERREGAILFISSVGGLRLAGHRRIQRHQGGGHAAGSQSCDRIWECQRARELHCARTGKNRLRPRTLGRPG